MGRKRKYGISLKEGRPKEYLIWSGMKQRCLNPNVPNYELYGGRGISVCDRWISSYQNFYDDMGPIPSKNHSLDRINNDGNYEPSNCRWATPEQQANNRRYSFFEFRGEIKSLKEWSIEFGVPMKVIRQRISRYKWPLEKALTTKKINTIDNLKNGVRFPNQRNYNTQTV